MMPIYVFCNTCLSFTRIKIIETVNIKPGIDGVHFERQNCGATWWEVDDARDEEEIEDELIQ